MIKKSIVNSSRLSLILRSILWASILALIILMFYVYHEGAWKDIFSYYRFFFDFKKLKIFIASFGPYAAFVFVMVQALQVVFAPVPGEVTGFVGGFLFGNVSGVILSTAGLTIGSIVAFGIARMLGMKFVEKIVKKEYIDKFNFFVTHKGLYITFIFFLIPGFPKDSLCYLLGLTRMRLIDFILMNVFGRLPGTLMLTLQGSAVKEGKYQAFFLLLVVSILLTFGLYLARNHIIRAFIFVVHPVIEFFQNLRHKKNTDRE
ncbi:MAG: TVP38/TMEM64 family inner membrane protein YdjZ [Syntrophorhabdus sp. PtaU1.Bin058]|nr:MAG: TVP38/TMEM64 family inner membrane protein YdjZ [Syntrophorhabdus sp. PtaU1.Bin058]